jgi:hypothetical protein
MGVNLDNCHLQSSGLGELLDQVRLTGHRRDARGFHDRSRNRQSAVFVHSGRKRVIARNGDQAYLLLQMVSH